MSSGSATAERSTRTVAWLLVCARTWPAGYVAHHYTRYLGDLSGGQVIGRRMAELLGEPERGTAFYRFAEIQQPKRFKDEYRRLLDAAPWDDDESGRVIDEVRVAYDGPSALAIAPEYRPEVVVLDIGMPGMDGYEVARRLRARPEFVGTLLVALTGWGQEVDRQRSREAGFDKHLVKPVDPRDLHSLLAEMPGGD